MNRRAAHHVPYHLSRGEQVGMDELMRKSDSFRSDRGKQMATQASMETHEDLLAQKRISDTADSRWNPLYKVSGAAALIAALIFRRGLPLGESDRDHPLRAQSDS